MELFNLLSYQYECKEMEWNRKERKEKDNQKIKIS